MNLAEMKKKVLRLIEEVSDTNVKFTDDPDIAAKLNDVINQVIFEVARMKKIPAKYALSVLEPVDYDLREIEGFYQLEHIKFTADSGNDAEVTIFGTFVEFPEKGQATIYYNKYPERITDNTVDTDYVFELSDDALEVAVYGIAADLLKSDISNDYGQIYEKRYETMLQRLDPRYSMGSIFIDGGMI